MPGYFETSRRQAEMASSHFSSATFCWFMSRRIAGLRASKRILGQELAEKLVGLGVLLGRELLAGHQVFGLDDRLLHRAPGIVGRVLGQELPPGGQGLGVVLLRLIGTAQQVLGLRQFLALAAAGIGQELLRARPRRRPVGRG